ncbi:MAG: FG-GAP-like repeat-containing protein [Candidatus Omnitrophica bacterium]|nr:FG-GAP-like repeat-containing protein [Candidatus Omnitrophota bacterium]
MACPHVSGLAALILSRHPEFTNEQIRGVIRASSDDIVNPINDGKNYPGFDIYSGYGRINAYKALQIDRIPLVKISSPSSGDVISGLVEIYGTATGPKFKSYTLEYGKGTMPTQWFKIKESTSSVEDGLLGTWDVNRLPYGIYTLRLIVQDALFPNPFEDRVTLSLTFSYQQGWPQKTEGMVISSPAIGDIDGDGRLEVVVGSYDKKVYAWRNDGTLVPGWPKETQGNIASSPALVNLDKTGNLEIVIGSNDGNVYAWHSNGTIVSGWPKATEGAVFSSPAIGDIDGDGNLEAVVGSYDNNVYVWRSDGTLLPGWPKETGSAVISSPALADLDGDGKLEIIIGSTDKKLYVFRYDGTLLPGWPKETDGQIVSSPAVGDLDNNASFEIVCGSNGNKVYVWDKNGNLISGWPRSTGGAIESSPILGDMDNDGKLEIVVSSFDNKVYAWHSDGTQVLGWPIQTGAQIVSSPVLVDINNDGFLDIVVGSLDNKFYAWGYDGKILKGWPIILKGAIESSASFGDLDSDGDTELVFGSLDNKVYAFDLDTGCLAGEIQWQMFKESPTRLSEAEFIQEADGSNGLLMFRVTAYDPEGDPLTFSAENLPEGAQFNSLTQIFRWQPTANQIGEYQVTFNVNDGGLSDSETITIDVVGNPLPYLYPIGGKKVKEGELLEFYLRATDPDNEPLAFRASNLPTGATFNPSIALFKWRPAFNQAGIYPNIRFEVTDGTTVVYDDITITVIDAPPDTTPPAKPGVDPVKSPTNINPVLLKGTKEANSSIWINGKQAVPIDTSITWSYSYRLVEGKNNLSITAQDASGNISEAVILEIVLDTVAPVVRITNPQDGTVITLP